ncbi:MAG: LysM domain-containing protein [Verrucomicrobiota bacterium]
MPGKEYIIHFGDSISAIAAAVSRLGRTLTPKEILEANPDLDPARLQVGQTIHIPAFETQSEGEGENAVPDSKH